MALANTQAILLCTALLFGVAQDGGNGSGSDAIRSTPAMMAEMQDLWQQYQKFSEGEHQQQAREQADKIVGLRRKAGMLESSKYARAFAARGWKNQQAGDLVAAVSDYRAAVRLAPSAREYRVALAGAMAARNLLDFPSYIPEYWQAFFGSFSSMRGRYLVATDLSLWFGVVLFTAAVLWILTMLIRHFRSLFHVFVELLSFLFTYELAVPVTAVVLATPFFFGVSIPIVVFGFAAATWAFQNKKEKILSVGTLVFLWLGFGFITLSSQMAAGLISTEVRAAFAAERHDAEGNVVLELERRLQDAGIIGEGQFLESLDTNGDPKSRLELFLYAGSIRKQGKTQGFGGVDVLRIFEALVDDEELGLLARVNAANIKFERGDHMSAQSAYQRVLDEDSLEPYALYNLWRLNEAMDLKDAESLWSRLITDHKDFVKKFDLQDSQEQDQDESTDPSMGRIELIDANVPVSTLESLQREGLAAANDIDDEEVEQVDLLGMALLSDQNYWLLFMFAGMLAGFFVFPKLGLAAPCSDCGKVYCRRCDLEPTTSNRCQACTAVQALRTPLDAELRRSQQQKISRFKKINKAKKLIWNIIAPGMGSAVSGRSVAGAGLLLLWSVLVSIIYSADRMPRAESMPFFTHWTFFLGLVALILAGIGYSLAIWLAWKEKK